MTEFEYKRPNAKYYGMSVELYKTEVSISCYGLLHMTEEWLGHNLTKDEAVELARNILKFYNASER